MLASPLSFSQRATSFIASRCQGIHQMPFSQARSRSAPNAHHAHTPKDARTTHIVRKDPQTTNSVRPLHDRPLWSQALNLTRQGLHLGISIPMPGHDRSTAPDPIHDSKIGSWCSLSCRVRFTVTTRFTMSKPPTKSSRPSASRHHDPLVFFFQTVRRGCLGLELGGPGPI